MIADAEALCESEGGAEPVASCADVLVRELGDDLSGQARTDWHSQSLNEISPGERPD